MTDTFNPAQVTSEAQSASEADSEIVESAIAETMMATARQTAGTTVIDERARNILLAPVADDDIEVREDGYIYLPAVHFRQRLVQAFGPAGWALIRTGEIQFRDNCILYPGALFIRGRYIAEAIGECDWNPKKSRMSYSSAVEAAKSNCIVRCCKDLGIAAELWNPRWSAAWKAAYAEELRDKKWQRKAHPNSQPSKPSATDSGNRSAGQNAASRSSSGGSWPARPWDAETLVIGLRHKLTTLPQEAQQTPCQPELLRRVVARLLAIYDQDQAKAVGLIWWVFGRKASAELMLGEAETILSWAGLPEPTGSSQEAAHQEAAHEAIVKAEAQALAVYLAQNDSRRAT